MTNEQKIKKLDILDEINLKIGGCFGDFDKIFADHPLDETQAKEFRKLASENNISLSEMQNIISGYLFRSGLFAEHCKEQTDKATKFFGEKLK